MVQPDWKHVETVHKSIRITRVNAKERHVDAVDLALGQNLCLDADITVNLDKIKKAKIYQATIKVYNSEFTEALERHLTESAMGNLDHLKALQVMKESGSKPTKLELISLKH